MLPLLLLFAPFADVGDVAFVADFAVAYVIVIEREKERQKDSHKQKDIQREGERDVPAVAAAIADV